MRQYVVPQLVRLNSWVANLSARKTFQFLLSHLELLVLMLLQVAMGLFSFWVLVMEYPL